MYSFWKMVSCREAVEMKARCEEGAAAATASSSSSRRNRWQLQNDHTVGRARLKFSARFSFPDPEVSGSVLDACSTVFRTTIRRIQPLV